MTICERGHLERQTQRELFPNSVSSSSSKCKFKLFPHISLQPALNSFGSVSSLSSTIFPAAPGSSFQKRSSATRSAPNSRQTKLTTSGTFCCETRLKLERACILDLHLFGCLKHKSKLIIMLLLTA